MSAWSLLALSASWSSLSHSSLSAIVLRIPALLTRAIATNYMNEEWVFLNSKSPNVQTQLSTYQDMYHNDNLVTHQCTDKLIHRMSLHTSWYCTRWLDTWHALDMSVTSTGRSGVSATHCRSSSAPWYSLHRYRNDPRSKKAWGRNTGWPLRREVKRNNRDIDWQKGYLSL